MDLERYMQINQVHLNWFTSFLFMMMSTMPIYLSSFRNLDLSSDFLLNRATLGESDEFDFIIVGAGSAGCVVANRLSFHYNVLLLEAGGESHPFHLFPMLALFMINYPEVDWQHKTVPQRYSTLGQNFRESLLSQGKALGGTSNINLMIHSRGNPKDFDTWAEMLDDPDWSYDKLLPFFKKHEDYHAMSPSNHTQADVHGTGGELNIQVPPYTGMAGTYLEAVQELGYKLVDLNGRYTEGFDYTYTPMKFGRRQSASAAFLEPIRKRSTLTIRKFAYVTKVLLDKDNKAYGVIYDHHGVPRVAHARREVIISAGALNSPKLLMLSGIGPKQDLEELGIPVKQNLPVGKNLQDHASIYLGPFFINESISYNPDRDLTAVRGAEFLAKGTGPFASPHCSAIGFISTKIAQAEGEKDWPDIQYIFAGVSVFKHYEHLISHSFNLNETIITKYYSHARTRDSFQLVVSNARPMARGDIRLRSSDSYTPAWIDPKYLDNEHDLRVTVEGVKRAIEICEKTTTFQKLGCHFTTERFPGCEDMEFRSDAYWECYIREYTVSLHHLVGTCSMGKSPQTGVVDSKLRVFGTKRLRVIDASVMPNIPVGNTNAPAIMIGEKGADLILKSPLQ